MKKIPKLVIVNNEPQIDGDFTFELSPITYQENYTPVRTITFQWNPESSCDISLRFNENSLNLLIAEKLKNDFYEFIKNSKVEYESA